MRFLLCVLLASLLLPQEVPIGYFGPADPDHPVGGTVWQGAALAVEEANQEGGYQGRPFRFVQGWDENPWSGGAAVVVRMAYQEKVWAIIGSIDGASTHLAEQVVAKARLTLIDPASTDKTVNAANVEWMFSCMLSDEALMAALVEAVMETERASYILASSTDHDSRVMTEEFLSLAARRHARPQRHLQFQNRSWRIPELAAQIAEARVRTVVVLAGATDSAAVVRELRKARRDLLIFGGPAMARRTFLEDAGPAAEGIRFPFPLRMSAASAEFSERFTARYGTPPDSAAFCAYDATRLLTAAIRKAGLDRARIRDAVKELSPWEGAGGTIQWDERGRNSGTAQLATILDGRVRPYR
jgi:ABC-type branched-subunit amino acid transport system substrate-binding protein